MAFSRSIIIFTLALVFLQVSSLPSRLKRQAQGQGQGQGQGFNWGNNSNNNRPPTTAAPDRAGTTTTTPSPEYSACVNRCPKTPEYNPVCGSNRVTYDNESRLRCANNCGLRVTKVFSGTCSPL